MFRFPVVWHTKSCRRMEIWWELTSDWDVELISHVPRLFDHSAVRIFVICRATSLVYAFKSRTWKQHPGEEAIQHYHRSTYGNLLRTGLCSETLWHLVQATQCVPGKVSGVEAGWGRGVQCHLLLLLPDIVVCLMGFVEFCVNKDSYLPDNSQDMALQGYGCLASRHWSRCVKVALLWFLLNFEAANVTCHLSPSRFPRRASRLLLNFQNNYRNFEHRYLRYLSNYAVARIASSPPIEIRNWGWRRCRYREIFAADTSFDEYGETRTNKWLSQWAPVGITHLRKLFYSAISTASE